MFVSFDGGQVYSQGAGPHKGEKRFEISLECIDPVVKRGTSPRYLIKIKNVSGKPVRVLNVTDRPDLQACYYRINVSSNGKRLSLPVGLACPGPFDPEHGYLSLPPGHSVSFFLKEFLVDLPELPRGSYRANVEILGSALESQTENYTSPETDLRVD